MDATGNSNKCTQKKVVEHFDFLSGVFMTQIIIMHILQINNEYNNSTSFQLIIKVSCFFVPWFYFKSGYFHNKLTSLKLSYIKKKAKKLLFPFITFFFTGLIIPISIEFIDSKRPIYRILSTPVYQLIMNAGGGLGNLPLWFLPSLFFTIITYSVIDTNRLYKAIIIFPLISYILYKNKIQLPLGLSNVFLGVFFFSFGCVFKKYEHKLSLYMYIIFLVIYMYILLKLPNYLDFRMNRLEYGNYFLYIIQAILGIMLAIKISLYISNIKTINYIGKNSIIYISTHWIISRTIVIILNIIDFNTSNVSKILISILIIFTSTPLLVHLFKNKKFIYLIGKD